MWVPTKFHVAAFKNAGVPEHIIRVVPESVDVDFFDPQQLLRQTPFVQTASVVLDDVMADNAVCTTTSGAEQRCMGVENASSLPPIVSENSRFSLSAGKRVVDFMTQYHLRPGAHRSRGMRVFPKTSFVDDVFRFVSVFKWEQRKGWDVLLGAYWQTFNRKDHPGVSSFCSLQLRGAACSKIARTLVHCSVVPCTSP